MSFGPLEADMHFLSVGGLIRSHYMYFGPLEADMHFLSGGGRCMHMYYKYVKENGRIRKMSPGYGDEAYERKQQNSLNISLF